MHTFVRLVQQLISPLLAKLVTQAHITVFYVVCSRHVLRSSSRILELSLARLAAPINHKASGIVIAIPMMIPPPDPITPYADPTTDPTRAPMKTNAISATGLR